MSTYLRLLRYLRPHLRIFGIAVGCMAVSSLLNGVQLGALIPLADRIATNSTIPTPEGLPGWLAAVAQWLNGVPQPVLLAGFALAIPVVFLIRAVFEFFQVFYMSDTAQRIIRDVRQALFDRFMGLSLDYHHSHPTGTTMSRILYDTGMIQNSITEGLYDLIYQSFQIVVFLSLALAIHWKLTLIIFLILPVIAWPMVQIGKLLKKISQQTQVAMGELNATILESLTGIQILQAFLSEAAAKAKFAAANERFYRVNRKLLKRMNFLSPITEVVGSVAAAFLLWYGVQAVLRAELSVGTFIVFLGSMLSLIRPLKRLARLHTINQQALASAERIFEVLDTPARVLEHAKARVLPPFHRDIAFEHVSFHYDSQPVLRNVSLAVAAGERLAIVGPSGGGKTTLVNLLLRFYDPSAGRVRLDGLDIKHVTLASLRGQIGVVTQETMLFNETVRANIALGRPEATLTEIVEAAKAANAHTFISRLPKGYDTVISERGSSLSGGERQRLAIARAFVKNPPILVLDEATSQLDAESEHLISEALARLAHGRTVLLIAHRLSTVQLAHRIVLIQEGRIVEHGSHDELLQKSLLYRRFCELQLIETGARASQSRKELA